MNVMLSTKGKAFLRIFILPSLLLGLPFLLGSCGTGSTDAFLGQWELTGATCNGVAVALPTDLTAFRAVYEEDGTFIVEWTGPTCPFARFRGTFLRKGLTVTEANSVRDCSGGACTVGPITGCTGTTVNNPPLEATYRISNPEIDVMETYAGNTVTICPGGSQEVLTYRKLE